MGDEREDEHRMTRVETILDAHEAILLRIEAKLDTRYMPRDELEAYLSAQDDKIRELQDNQRAHHNNIPMWVAASAGVLSVFNTLWPHVQ